MERREDRSTLYAGKRKRKSPRLTLTKLNEDFQFNPSLPYMVAGCENGDEGWWAGKEGKEVFSYLVRSYVRLPPYLPKCCYQGMASDVIDELQRQRQ